MHMGSHTLEKNKGLGKEHKTSKKRRRSDKVTSELSVNKRLLTLN